MILLDLTSNKPRTELKFMVELNICYVADILLALCSWRWPSFELPVGHNYRAIERQEKSITRDSAYNAAYIFI